MTPEERYLLDREQILDCVSLACRGIDRHDTGLLLDRFLPGATVEVGEFRGAAPGFVDWLNSHHRETDTAHSHNITSHNCELDGDTARAESYVIIARLDRAGETATVTGGRYLDRFERRDGAWRIAERRYLTDWALTADGRESRNPDGYVRGRWDSDDITYLRPLALSPKLMAQMRPSGD